MVKVKKVMDRIFVSAVLTIVLICAGYMASNLFLSILNLLKAIYLMITGG